MNTSVDILMDLMGLMEGMTQVRGMWIEECY